MKTFDLPQEFWEVTILFKEDKSTRTYLGCMPDRPVMDSGQLRTTLMDCHVIPVGISSGTI